jgi:hypothetical protein
MSYQLYKPLRNHLRGYSLLESLGVIRAYAQYLQFGQPFPTDVEVNKEFLLASRADKGVFEWELELLARELILNAPDQGKTDLRPWKEFSAAVNRLKALENDIAADPAYRDLYKDNILLELYRLADAKAGLYPHWKPTDAPVYPVVVTLEEWYAFGDRILPAIDERVREGLTKAKIDLAILETSPYSICAVEDLEHAMQIMAQNGINKFMQRKHEGEHRLWTYGSVMFRHFPEELKKVRNLFPDAGKAIHPAL